MQFEVEQYGLLVRGIAYALAGYFAWRLLLQPSLVENFRQKMFAHRRRLFLLGMDGKVSRDDAGYIRLYDSLNFLIRYADRISFVRLVGMEVAIRLNGLKPPEHSYSGEVFLIKREMAKDFSYHMIFSSIPMIILAVVIVIISLFWQGIRGVLFKRIESITDQMKDEDQMGLALT